MNSRRAAASSHGELGRPSAVRSHAGLPSMRTTRRRRPPLLFAAPSRCRGEAALRRFDRGGHPRWGTALLRQIPCWPVDGRLRQPGAAQCPGAWRHDRHALQEVGLSRANCRPTTTTRVTSSRAGAGGSCGSRSAVFGARREATGAAPLTRRKYARTLVAVAVHTASALERTRRFRVGAVAHQGWRARVGHGVGASAPTSAR